MNLFEVVKASINTQEAAQAYGIDVNHYGMALCPFHNDRRPSLYVSDDHYHCFACGEHGDVIDLTVKLFDLRLYDAAKTGVGLSSCAGQALAGSHSPEKETQNQSTAAS